jgi:hypothetical protein
MLPSGQSVPHPRYARAIAPIASRSRSLAAATSAPPAASQVRYGSYSTVATCVVAVTATVVDVTSMDVVVVSEGLTAAVVVAVATDGADSVVDVPEQPTSRAAAAAVAMKSLMS